MNTALLVIAGIVVIAGVFLYLRNRSSKQPAITPIAPSNRRLLDEYQDYMRKTPAPSVDNYTRWRTDLTPFDQSLFDWFRAYKYPIRTPP